MTDSRVLEGGQRGCNTSAARAQQRYELARPTCFRCERPLTKHQFKHGCRFCSRSCARKKRAAQPLYCRHCKKEFFRARKRGGFCSFLCSSMARRATLGTAKTEAAIRRYLLRTREYRCEICFLTEWRGVPIPLEVDHADGNSDNNEEENLRLICMNCHGLTPTHRGRNRGRGRTRQKIKNRRYASGLKY